MLPSPEDLHQVAATATLDCIAPVGILLEDHLHFSCRSVENALGVCGRKFQWPEEQDCGR
jgi:hypothetical protein